MSSFPWGFREGHPTRMDLLVTVLAGGLAVENGVTAESLALPWVAVGFLVSLVVLGPVAASGIGDGVGELARSTGLGGRLIAFAAILGLFWAASLVLDPSMLPGTDIATGMLAAVAVFGVLEAVASRVDDDR